MSTISNDQLLSSLKWRYATKQFDPAQKISPNNWRTLEDALVLTPSSFGLQPWKFIVTTDQDTKQKLRAVSWNQEQVSDCSHLVVFAIPEKFGQPEVDAHVTRVFEIHNTAPEKLTEFREKLSRNLLNGKRDLGLWAMQQTFIALGNFMTSAALLGIDTCALGGIEAEKYDEILELKKLSLKTVIACAAGHRDANDKYASLPKVRFKNEDVIIRR